jgi:hypothetical protein
MSTVNDSESVMAVSIERGAALVGVTSRHSIELGKSKAT